MLEVNIDKIIPVTDARDSLNKIVDEVTAGDSLYVLTVNGKPSAVVVGVHHLEKLTGMKGENIMDDITTPTPDTSADAGQAATVPAADVTAPSATQTDITPSTTTPTDTTAAIPAEDLTADVAPAPDASAGVGQAASATPATDAAADLFADSSAATTDMPATAPVAPTVDTTPTADSATTGQFATPDADDLNAAGSQPQQ